MPKQRIEHWTSRPQRHMLNCCFARRKSTYVGALQSALISWFVKFINGLTQERKFCRATTCCLPYITIEETATHISWASSGKRFSQLAEFFFSIITIQHDFSTVTTELANTSKKTVSHSTVDNIGALTAAMLTQVYKEYSKIKFLVDGWLLR